MGLSVELSRDSERVRAVNVRGSLHGQPLVLNGHIFRGARLTHGVVSCDQQLTGPIHRRKDLDGSGDTLHLVFVPPSRIIRLCQAQISSSLHLVGRILQRGNHRLCSCQRRIEVADCPQQSDDAHACLYSIWMRLAREGGVHLCSLSHQLGCLHHPLLLVTVGTRNKCVSQHLEHGRRLCVWDTTVGLLVDADRLPQQLYCKAGLLLHLDLRLHLEDARHQRMPPADCLCPLAQCTDQVLPGTALVTARCEDLGGEDAEVHFLGVCDANVFVQRQSSVDGAGGLVMLLCHIVESRLSPQCLHHLQALLTMELLRRLHCLDVELRCLLDLAPRRIDACQALQHSNGVLCTDNNRLHLRQQLEGPVLLVQVDQEAAVVRLGSNDHGVVRVVELLRQFARSLQQPAGLQVHAGPVVDGRQRRARVEEDHWLYAYERLRKLVSFLEECPHLSRLAEVSEREELCQAAEAGVELNVELFIGLSNHRLEHLGCALGLPVELLCHVQVPSVFLYLSVRPRRLRID
mmetsp:Transcript_16680/g.65167  ORF Transcript_16680/g.65167 Transcript_16680/m.65167 type:complete len:518 (+) Transcript_16680:585-2138(+)